MGGGGPLGGWGGPRLGQAVPGLIGGGGFQFGAPPEDIKDVVAGIMEQGQRQGKNIEDLLTQIRNYLGDAASTGGSPTTINLIVDGQTLSSALVQAMTGETNTARI